MYRNYTSQNPTPAVLAELNKRGIADHGQAMFGGSTRLRDVFVMDDGRIIKADSRVVAECARWAK